MLEKGKENLSRSKSELGEQHRKMISHLSRGRSEIQEQNKRILARVTMGVEKSKKLIPQGLSKNKAEMGTADGTGKAAAGSADGTGKAATGLVATTASISGSSQTPTTASSGMTRLTMTGRQTSSKMISTLTGRKDSRSPQPIGKDLDSILLDLGINPDTFNVSNNANSDTLRPDPPSYDMANGTLKAGVSPTNNNGGYCDNRPLSASYDTSVPSDLSSLPLERHLEEGYGEFDFIDDKDMTLTRIAPPPPPPPKEDNFSEEIFNELRNSNNFNKTSLSSSNGDVG